MNNLNDPPIWNIQPDRRAGGAAGGGAADGSQWNYALLVPMLGLAAFRWIWTRDCQREIHKVKSQCDSEVLRIKGELEARYQGTLTKRTKEVANLQLALEKERQRVEGYKRAMSSMMLLQADQQKQLQKERGELEEEKERLVKSGAAGAVLYHAIKREEGWHRRATAALKELESQLVERQNVYCSYFTPKEQRLEMESNMLLKVVKEPIGKGLHLESDLKDIFKRDRHCAEIQNVDKKKNGSLMWVYLRYWQLQIAVQKHQRAEQAVFRGRTPSDQK